MYTYNANVLSIYDGDTITVKIDLGFHIFTEIKLRLWGINAPELKGDSHEAGAAARDYLAGLLKTQSITVETYKDRQEKYGRWLAIVYVDGKNINDEMVNSGHAVKYMVNE